MKVRELATNLQAYDPETEVFLQDETRGFADRLWIGIMDISHLFDEEKSFQFVISP